MRRRQQVSAFLNKSPEATRRGKNRIDHFISMQATLLELCSQRACLQISAGECRAQKGLVLIDLIYIHKINAFSQHLSRMYSASWDPCVTRLKFPTFRTARQLSRAASCSEETSVLRCLSPCNVAAIVRITLVAATFARLYTYYRTILSSDFPRKLPATRELSNTSSHQTLYKTVGTASSLGEGDFHLSGVSGMFGKCSETNKDYRSTLEQRNRNGSRKTITPYPDHLASFILLLSHSP